MYWPGPDFGPEELAQQKVDGCHVVGMASPSLGLQCPCCNKNGRVRSSTAWEQADPKAGRDRKPNQNQAWETMMAILDC